MPGSKVRELSTGWLKKAFPGKAEPRKTETRGLQKKEFGDIQLDTSTSLLEDSFYSTDAKVSRSKDDKSLKILHAEIPSLNPQLRRKGLSNSIDIQVSEPDGNNGAMLTTLSSTGKPGIPIAVRIIDNTNTAHLIQRPVVKEVSRAIRELNASLTS